MKAWPLHIAFASMLVGSLAAKQLAADTPVDSDNFVPAIIRVAHAHGLAFRRYTTLAGTGVRAIVFDTPGCPQPVLVVVLQAGLEQEAVAHLDSDEGDVLRYVYIGRSWEKLDRLALFVERMKYAGLKTFRLTRYDPGARLLLVQSPSGCHAADRIDWRNVWNRDYLAAIRADGGAASR